MLAKSFLQAYQLRASIQQARPKQRFFIYLLVRYQNLAFMRLPCNGTDT